MKKKQGDDVQELESESEEDEEIVEGELLEMIEVAELRRRGK